MNGSCSLVIRDVALDFDDINRKLAIVPTSIHKKGMAIREGGKTRAPFDVWQFEVEICEQTEPEEAIKLLLDIIFFGTVLTKIRRSI